MFVSKCFDKLSFSFWKINFDGKNFGQFGEEKKISFGKLNCEKHIR